MELLSMGYAKWATNTAIQLLKSMDKEIVKPM